MSLFRSFKNKRRERLKALETPEAWIQRLPDLAPLYARLPEEDRRDLHGMMHVFLAEKSYQGCDGLEVTDDMRAVIASQACLLLLRLDTDYFPELSSILIYPGEYVAPVVEYDGGIVTEYEMDRTGETWDQGSVVLSWEDVLSSGHDRHGSYNVVLHEFAHQLDFENGELDGVPELKTDADRASWREVMSRAFARLRSEVENEQPATLDAYGANSPEEFFAVATEAFFEAPAALAGSYPDVYDTLKSYYNQDPATW